MLKQLLGSRKSILFVLAGLILLALLILVWRVISLPSSKVVDEPILKISYCGAEPEELCILSFGRDAEENLVVNLFVPDRDFPDFYMIIKRLTGESIYECEKHEEVRTSVFCYGDMISLQEKIEVNLISIEDERLIAVGNFRLNAILVSESSPGAGIDGTPTPTLSEATGTPTPTSTTVGGNLTVTPTFTPDPSYPNPSYP